MEGEKAGEDKGEESEKSDGTRGQQTNLLFLTAPVPAMISKVGRCACKTN